MEKTMKTIGCFFFCIAILAVLSPALLTVAVGADAKAGDAARGKIVYERYCVSCHGVRGDGAGEFAMESTPRPRDFRQGVFKWRSTPSGSLPLTSDLERTIKEGVYWTLMPSWYPLNQRARLDVIAYIQTFSPRWKADQPGVPIVIPSEPARNPESVARGRTIYETQQCGKCHGDQGTGDGPAAKTLVDDWGDLDPPFDLTKGHMKGGATGPDLYRVFMTGLNGTPMPSYADSIKPEEAWDLVHYMQSLTPSRATKH
jgi:cytochrome c oxidase cbb3-type subunit 2